MLATPNSTRRDFYTESVDAALRRHEASLRAVHASLCGHKVALTPAPTRTVTRALAPSPAPSPLPSPPPSP